MAVEDYFASGFGEARIQFHKACLAAGVRRTDLGTAHGMFGGIAGAQVEVVRLGDRGARNLLVVSPGSRLADALCCSGIEVGWLTEFAEARLPPQTALVMINTGAAPSAGGEPPPEQREFPQWDSDLLAKVEQRYAEYARERGIDHEGVPLTPGSPGTQAVPGFASDVLDGIAGELDSAREGRILFMETAVGLGPFGQVEIVACHPRESEAAQRAGKWFALSSPTDGEPDHGQGPDLLVAGLMRRFGGAEITAIRMVFGTYSTVSILETLAGRSEHRAVPDTRRIFYPEAKDWRRKVWQGAAVGIQRALASIQQT